MSKVKPFLAVLLGAACLVSVGRIEANSGVPAHVTVLSAEDAADIHGSACPIVPILPEDVCHGAGSAGTCSSNYWNCAQPCDYDCTAAVSKRATAGGGLDIRTRPCIGARESGPRACNTLRPTSTTGTCTVPYMPWNWCYCTSPYTPINCGNATYTEFDTCN